MEVKIGLKKLKSDKKPQLSRCVLYEQLSALWNLQKFLGVFPFSEDVETGDITFKWLSIPIFYSGIIALFVYVGAANNLGKRFHVIRFYDGSDSFQRKTYELLNIFCVCPVLIIPWSCWSEMDQFIVYLQKWALLQKLYQQNYNPAPITKYKRTTKIITIGFTIGVLLTSAMFYYLDDYGDLLFLEPLPYIINLLSLKAVLVYFSIVSRIMTEINQDFQIKLVQDLKNPKSGSKIQQHRIFWVKFGEINSRLWSFYSKRGLVTAGTGTFLLSLATYYSLKMIVMSDNAFLNLRGSVMFVCLLETVMISYYFGNRAEELKIDVGKRLISKFYKNKKNLEFYDKYTASELKIFNKMLKMSDVKVAGNGYFAIDQSYLISIFSVVTTNLLILIQFEMFVNKLTLNMNEKKIVPLECILYTQMKPFWKFLRLMGLLPYVEVPETGNVMFHWLSTSVLYSAVCITCVYSVVIIVMIQKTSFDKTKFDHKVQNFQVISILLPLLFIPFTFWLDTKSFVDYIRRWTKFEIDYHKICKKRLQINGAKKCAFSLVVIVTYTLAVNLVFGLSDPNALWWHIIPYTYNITWLFLQLPYSGFITWIQILMCENIKTNLLKDVVTQENVATVFANYRLLWFQLTDLSADIFSIFVRAFLLYTVDTIASGTFNLYMFVSLIIAKQINEGVIALFVMLFLLLLQKYFVVNRSQMLYNAVGPDFVSDFFKIRKELKYSADTMLELKLFVNTLRIANVKICNGFFTLDQSTFISLLSVISTYVLILVQFRVDEQVEAIQTSLNGTKQQNQLKSVI